MVERPFQEFPDPRGRYYLRTEIDDWKKKWEKRIQANFIACQSLNTEIKNLESVMEEIRNQRQREEAGFENADEKMVQIFNLLSNALRNMRDTQSAIIRNIR